MLATVTADRESEVYQFVVRAVVHDGDAEVARLAERTLALQDGAGGRSGHVVGRSSRSARMRSPRRRRAAAAARPRPPARVGELEALAEERQRHIDGIYASRSYRMLAPFRMAFARRR